MFKVGHLCPPPLSSSSWSHSTAQVHLRFRSPAPSSIFLAAAHWRKGQCQLISLWSNRANLRKQGNKHFDTLVCSLLVMVLGSLDRLKQAVPWTMVVRDALQSLLNPEKLDGLQKTVGRDCLGFTYGFARNPPCRACAVRGLGKVWARKCKQRQSARGAHRARHERTGGSPSSRIAEVFVCPLLCSPPQSASSNSHT